MKPFAGHVTAAMTEWSRSLVVNHDLPIGYEETHVFGEKIMMARIEWHAWTYEHGVRVEKKIRGVTLYEVPHETEAP